MRCRATGLLMGAMMKLTISTILHRERRFTRRRRLSLLHLLCKCGAHLRVGAALDRSRYNKKFKRRSLFFLFTHSSEILQKSERATSFLHQNSGSRRDFLSCSCRCIIHLKPVQPRGTLINTFRPCRRPCHLLREPVRVRACLLRALLS